MTGILRNYPQRSQAILLVAIFVLFLAPPATASKPGWLIRQNSQTYGIVKTLVSADGMRLEMGDIKVGMQAPQYRVKFWNQRTKFYFEETIEEFQERVPKRNIPKGWLKKVVAGQPFEETLAGVKGKHYRWIGYDPKNTSHFLVLFDYVCTENLGLPKKLNDVASICCYVPPGKGLPLRITGGGNIVYLQTTLVNKAVVDPAIFKLPKGYTKVNSEMEVLMKERGMAKEDDVSDLFKAIPKHD